MSKLAVIRQYQYSPAAGGLFSFLSPVVKFVSGGVSKLLGSKAAQTAVKVAKSPVGQAAIYAGAGAAASKLLQGAPGMPGGASGSFGYRRRGRGITARELRGYRKVARLLHQEGMVSRRARGRR